MRYFLFLLFPFPICLYIASGLFWIYWGGSTVGLLPTCHNNMTYVVFNILMWMTQQLLNLLLYSLLSSIWISQKLLLVLVFEGIQMRFMESWVPNWQIAIKFVEANEVEEEKNCGVWIEWTGMAYWWHFQEAKAHPNIH
jgi:hypothetical protein